MESKITIKLIMKILEEKRKVLISKENDAIITLNNFTGNEMFAKVWFENSQNPEGDKKALTVINLHEKREMLDEIYYELDRIIDEN